MEIFRNVNVDWLGKRRLFFAISSVLAILIIATYFVRGGFTLGIEFSGGVVAFIKFKDTPDVGQIRSALQPHFSGTPIIQTFDARGENKVQVKLEQSEEGTDIGAETLALRTALNAIYNAGLDSGGLLDINQGDLGLEALSSQFVSLDPLGLAATKTLAEQADTYRGLATRVLDHRKGIGLIRSLDDLRAVEGMTDAAVSKLKTRYYAGNFTIQGVQSIGAVVGRDLRSRARNAILASMVGMLIYIAFRFKHWSYGVGAVVALLHDVVITLGAFLLTNKEISLTVVASILTIVGYSVNDTIVIFDRVRDNLRVMRRDNLKAILNTSINQTLQRTFLTSGFTFLAVISIYLFGGEVLDGFAFALVIGIITGTYSTVAIAGPIVLMWQDFFGKGREAKRG